MNLFLRFIISKIYRIYLLIIINYFLLKKIICEERQNPSIINDNYYKISLLSSGNTFKIIDSISILICSYDSHFSKKIFSPIDYNIILSDKKNILCLLKNETNSYLYLINNKDTYLYKIEISNIIDSNNIDLIPYADKHNYLYCLIILYNTEQTIIKYIINLKNNLVENNKTFLFEKENKIEQLDQPLGCLFTDKLNNYLACFYIYSKWLYSFIFEIHDDIEYYGMNNITCKNCGQGISSVQYSLATNKNQNIIFIFFKQYNKDFNFYFYNSTDNSFLYHNNFVEINNTKPIKCDDNINNYYFNESKEYVAICHRSGKEIYVFRMNDTFLENNYFLVSYINASEYNCENADRIILSLSLEGKYILKSDCYHNNTYMSIFDIIIEGFFIENSDKATTNINIEHIIYKNEKRPINEILTNLDLTNLEIGEYYEITNPNYIISIRPTTSRTIPSKTHLNLTQCESVIKTKNELNSSSILTLFQLEVNNKNSESLINKVEYKLYDENFIELELSPCANLNLEVIYGIKKDATIDFSQIIYYQEKGINIFNLSDNFFNDICQIHSYLENDIILEDRIEDIFQNYSVCEEGCIYKEFDKNYYTIKCECKIKQNLNYEIPPITLEKSDISTNNFKVFKCINLVFASDDKINNIGFWIFTFILGGHVPLLFHYLNSGIKPIQDFIFNEMAEYGYTKEKSNNKKNDNVKKKRKFKKLKKKKKKKKIHKTNENNNNIENENEEEDEENENETDENNNEKEEKEKDNSMAPPKKNIKKINGIINLDKNIINKRKSQIFNANRKLSNKLNNIKKGDNRLRKKSVFVYNNKKNNNIIDNNNNNNIDENIKTNKNIKHKNIRQKKIIKKSMNKNIEISSSQSDKSNHLMKNMDKSKSPNFLETQDFDFQFEDKEEENDKEKFVINLININLNEKDDRYTIPNDSNIILNNYTYEEAVEYDKRPFFKIFYIFLITKEVIFHTFLYKTPLELLSIKICVLIFILSSNLAFNAFFYFNSFISKKYRYTKGLFFFTFTNGIIIIILACIINFIILILITKLSNSTYNIREIFKKEEDKLKSDKNYNISEKRKEEIKKEIEEILKKYKKKILALFVVDIIVLFFYWYYVTAFCHVYTNTQISWILNSFLSIVFCFILQCIFCFILAKLYRISLDSNIQFLYKVVMFLYNFV